MIKLSDVKVRPQYRTWVRYRLMVLEYAWAHGPAAAGRHYRISARTIRRWRRRWRSSGVEGLVPSYPRHRARRVSPAAIEWIRHARQELGLGAARTRLWLQRVHEVAPVWWRVNCFRDGHCTTPEGDSEIAPTWSIVAPGGTVRSPLAWVRSNIIGDRYARAEWRRHGLYQPSMKSKTARRASA
jgi:helix-turn-helix protein